MEVKKQADYAFIVKKLSKPKEEKKPRADEPLHAQDGDVEPNEPEEPVREFKTKLNKYGFLHVPKRAVPSLHFEPEKPLTARIEGEALIISAATENQPRTEKT